MKHKLTLEIYTYNALFMVKIDYFRAELGSMIVFSLTSSNKCSILHITIR